jgi:lysyl-tRNA synthetase class I
MGLVRMGSVSDDIVERLRHTRNWLRTLKEIDVRYVLGDAADEIERLQEVITDFVEAREALNKNEWRDDSGAFRSVYQDASRALEREARRG